MERYKVYKLSFFDQISPIWSSCILCDQPSHRHLDLCHSCECELPWLDNPCPRCAYPLGADPFECEECRTTQPLQQRAVSLFSYEFPLNRLVGAFKYQQRLAYGKVLADLLAFQIATSRPAADYPLALVPVPLHNSRLRERGYNQAALLARQLSRRLHIPLADKALVKRQATHRQAELSAQERENNLQDAFSVCTRQTLPSRVALIDDVCTTGATARSACAALQKAGVTDIEVWTLARSL